MRFLNAVLPLVLLALGGTVLAALPLYIAGLLDQVGGIPAKEAAARHPLRYMIT